MKCLHPITIRNPKKDRSYSDPFFLTVPCGKCLACQQNYRSEWSFRMDAEYLKSGPCFFVTLTYDEDCVPTDSNGLKVCSKDDVQKFHKKLFHKIRSKYDTYLKAKNNGEEILTPLDMSSDRHFRFFLCCEYGPKTHRPHYHGVYFFPQGCNVTLYEFQKEVARSWSLPVVPLKYNVDGSPVTRQLGNVVVDICNSSRIGYVTKYVTKSLLPREDVRCWSLKSTRPPLGSHLLSDAEWTNYISNGGVPKVFNFPCRLPRYLATKLNLRPEYTIDIQREHVLQDESSFKMKFDNSFKVWKDVNHSSDIIAFMDYYFTSCEKSMEFNYLSKLTKGSYE